MNKKSLIAILVILFAPLLVLGVLSRRSNVTMAEKQTNQPKIIKFSSHMCLDCKELKKNMDKVYPKYQNDILLEEIQVQDNTPYNNQMIKKYNITLVPTVIILDKNGKQINRFEGNIEKKELDKLMSGLVHVK